MDHTIKIPAFLHEIHGKQSTWFDIFSTHLLAVLAVAGTYYLVADLGLPIWKQVLLIILAYDLGGGVLANFTYSTKQYYGSQKRRLTFLSLHVLQPFLLSLIFPEHRLAIILFSGFTLLAAFSVNAITEAQKQVVVGGFLALTGIIVLHSIPLVMNPPVFLLLTLFLLKLPLSFSVRWYDLQPKP